MFDWPRIADFYNGGATLRDCREQFGVSLGSLSNAIKRGDIIPRSKGRHIDLHRYLTLHMGDRTAQKKIRKKVLESGAIPYLCGMCGISEWRGKPLTLRLDHKNGDGRDQRLDNFRFICPNCDSQEPTHGHRNRGRYSQPMVGIVQQQDDAL